jgi:hypothetical protein
MTTTQSLTETELRQGRVFLEEAHGGVTGAIKRLSEAQWRFQPSAERWSIAEIMDHVIFVQERVLGPIREQLTTAPPPAPEFDYQGADGVVLNQFTNRIVKFPAPEFAIPKGRYSKPEALARFGANHKALLECLESTPDLRLHALESMPMKFVSQGAYQVMDGYQWILAAAAHTQRHTKQILEVAAESTFPE